MLNDKQQIALNAKEQFVFLLAGAGTGKTTVVVNRVNKILNNNLHEKILLITFTKKATLELKERVNKNLDNLLITTFHSLCYQLLKDLKIKIVTNNDLLLGDFTLEEVNEIDLYKRNKIINKKVIKYNNYLKQINKRDFNDLEIILLRRLKEDKKFRGEIESKFTYIFIDEFQDTSINQYKILKYLCKKETNIFAVGDPDQSIYAFRGASDAVIKRYLADFKGVNYKLDINYRSAFKIVTCANNLISHNKREYKKRLTPNNMNLGFISIRLFKDENEEALAIIKEIKALLNKGIKFQEMAILYRNHYLGNELRKLFFKHYLFDINLLTIHKAKGLEFKVVFIIGLNEGVLPQFNSNVLEERRLCFVAVTRAKEYLYLSYLSYKKPSRFIKEMYLK